MGTSHAIHQIKTKDVDHVENICFTAAMTKALIFEFLTFVNKCY